MTFRLPLLFFLSVATFACEDTNTEQTVKQLIRDSFQEIWSDCDTGKISTYHTADFLLLEAGKVWDNDSIRAYQIEEMKITAKEQYTRKNAFDFITFEQQGNLAWVAYHNEGRWIRNDTILGKVQWLESAVAIQTNRGWKLRMLHSTRKPRNR